MTNRYPKELSYDLILQSIDRNEFMTPGALERTHLTKTSLEYQRFKLRYRSLLEQAKVYVLSKEALQCVLEATERIAKTPKTLRAISRPTPPALPLWVEFDHQTFQSPEDPENEVYSMFFVADAKDKGGFRSSMQCTKDGGGGACVFQSNGNWGTDQILPCRLWPECPIALIASKNQKTPNFMIDQKRDAAEATMVGCKCYSSGQWYAAFVWSLMHFLTAEGAEHVLIERNTKQKSRRSGKKKNNQTVSVVRPFRYEKITLSQVKHYRIERSNDLPQKYEVLADQPLEGEKELSISPVITTVRYHPRLLIPGPGKPWLPPARVVWVKPHQKRVYRSKPIRYYVIP